MAVPGASDHIAEVLFEGALFREKTRVGARQLTLDFIEELEPKKQAIHAEWENVRDREKATRSRFALTGQWAAELTSVRNAIGRSEDVAVFLYTVLKAANVVTQQKGQSVSVFLTPETPRALRQAIGLDSAFVGRFDFPLEEDEIYLGRTSPIVERGSRNGHWIKHLIRQSARARECRPAAAGHRPRAGRHETRPRRCGMSAAPATPR